MVLTFCSFWIFFARRRPRGRRCDGSYENIDAGCACKIARACLPLPEIVATILHLSVSSSCPFANSPLCRSRSVAYPRLPTTQSLALCRRRSR